MSGAAWSGERIALLRQLVTDGVPYQEIGARLGTTKNAVIGKAYRLGLAHPNSPPPKEPPKPPVASDFPPAGHCLWAFGNVGDPAFRFCGDRVERPGESWCQVHRARVYIKPVARAESGADA